MPDTEPKATASREPEATKGGAPEATASDPPEATMGGEPEATMRRTGRPPRRPPRFAHEALAVVLQVRHQQLNVLLWQRGAPPFEGRWALPGGPLGADERLGTSLGRHLATKVDLTDIAYLEQLETRSDPPATRGAASWPPRTWPSSPPR